MDVRKVHTGAFCARDDAAALGLRTRLIRSPRRLPCDSAGPSACPGGGPNGPRSVRGLETLNKRLVSAGLGTVSFTIMVGDAHAALFRVDGNESGGTERVQRSPSSYSRTSDTSDDVAMIARLCRERGGQQSEMARHVCRAPEKALWFSVEPEIRDGPERKRLRSQSALASDRTLFLWPPI